jgi:hypothetical protein
VNHLVKPVQHTPTLTCVALHASEVATGGGGGTGGNGGGTTAPPLDLSAFGDWHDRLISLLSKGVGGAHLFTAAELRRSDAQFFEADTAVSRDGSDLSVWSLNAGETQAVNTDKPLDGHSTGILSSLYFSNQYYVPGVFGFEPNLGDGPRQGYVFDYISMQVDAVNGAAFTRDFLPALQSLLSERDAIDIASNGFDGVNFRVNDFGSFTLLEGLWAPSIAVGFNEEIPVEQFSIQVNK